jgi:hypothetical protein
MTKKAQMSKAEEGAVALYPDFVIKVATQGSD